MVLRHRSNHTRDGEADSGRGARLGLATWSKARGDRLTDRVPAPTAEGTSRGSRPARFNPQMGEHSVSSCRARDLPDSFVTRPSFWEGVARIFDFTGSLNTSAWPTDEEALRSDWEAVGNDMRAAVAAYEQEHGLAPRRGTAG
jgi:hypothetical protein